jgi:serine/threonine protein kinase
MEFLENGSLIDAIHRNGSFHEIIAQRYFSEIFASVEYLHTEMGISHRDLKCENIMLDRNHTIRLIDFGFSNRFNFEDDTFKTKCGIPAYCAPEILLGKPYTKSVDFWSLGVILYHMLTGVLPFEGKSIDQLIQNQMKNVFFPSYLSQNAISLIKGLLTSDPFERFNSQQIKNHIWFLKTHYSEICQISEQLKSAGIQKEILLSLKEFQIDSNLMKSEMKQNIFSVRTSCYRQLARDLEIQKMFEPKSKLKSLSHPSL